MSKRVKLRVLGFSLKRASEKLFSLVMESEDNKKRLVILTAMTDAQSIALKLQNIPPLCPFLHDLVGHLLTDFSIKLLEVNIYKHDGEIFYSRILFNQFGKEIEFEASTVDAICIALRTKSPIFIDEAIMDKLAVDIEEKDLDIIEPCSCDDHQYKHSYDEVLTESDLRKLLNDAVRDENYEVAAAIRDELKRRGES